MKRRPSMAWANVARSDDGVRSCGRRTVRVVAMRAATAKVTAATRYGTVGSTAQEAADGRADDQAELPRARVQGDEAGQPAVGRDQRWQGAERRRGEGPRRAEEEGDAEDGDRRGR